MPTQPSEISDKTVWHVGVSGGKDSAAALLWMVRESGIDPSRIRASFCDIGNDHPWTLEHVQLLSEKVHPIETITPELNFFDLALKKKRFPSTKARFCTEHLKIHPTQDHIQSIRREGLEPIAVSGVRGDESTERGKLEEWDYSGTLLCVSWRPLIRWTLPDVLAIHKRHGILMNPLYGIGAERVGCWPCIMSRKKEIRTIALKFPERIDEIRTAERNQKAVNGRYSSFYPPSMTPARFHSQIYFQDGEMKSYPTIDDVVKWALTGDRARGSWEDHEEKEPLTCKSGFCE